MKNQSMRQMWSRRAAIGLWLIPLLMFSSGCDRGDKTLTPQEKINSGWDNYRAGEFKFAVSDFEAALASPNISLDEQVKATYGLATTWALRRPDENTAKAAALHTKVLQLDPKHELAAWSLLSLARLKHMVPVDQTFDSKQVCQAYQDVIDRYPNSIAAEEALILQQSIIACTFDPADAAKVIDTLKKFVDTHPKSHFRSFAYTIMGTCYHTLKQPQQELWANIRSYETQEVDPSNPFFENSGVYWSIATFAEYEVGDFATARKFYNKLITEYPVDFRQYAARQALKRMDDIEAKFRNELAKGKS